MSDRAIWEHARDCSLAIVTPAVRTVWIVDAAHDAPRLVTAYPAG